MNMESLRIIQVILLLLTRAGSFEQEITLPVQHDRWKIQPDGSIEWKIDQRVPHFDHVEMDGQRVALWMQYGVDSNASPKLSRTIIFPSYRLLPVRTIAHMMYNVEDNELPRILVNDKLLKAGVFNAAVSAGMPERVTGIRQKGMLEIDSEVDKEGLHLQRTFFPSVDKPVAIEKLLFINGTSKPLKIEMEYLWREVQPSPKRTSNGPIYFVISTVGEGVRNLQPGDSVAFAITYQATRGNETPLTVDVNSEEQSRRDWVSQIGSKLVLETPDAVLNTMFAFAKIRGAESIYNTKAGLMHGPGGLRYYAAIWANDQAEYINPFFAFLGDTLGNRSAMNAYRMFAKYMNPGFTPIPSAIIAEGDSTVSVAGDRGDMAMIA